MGKHLLSTICLSAALLALAPALRAPLAPTSASVSAATADFADMKPAGYDSIPTDIGSIISQAIQLIMTAASILLLFYLLWGGIDWLTAGSDASQVTKAIDKIKFALIGIVVVAASWAIWSVVMRVAFQKDVGDSVELDIPAL